MADIDPALDPSLAAGAPPPWPPPQWGQPTVPVSAPIAAADAPPWPPPSWAQDSASAPPLPPPVDASLAGAPVPDVGGPAPLTADAGGPPPVAPPAVDGITGAGGSPPSTAAKPTPSQRLAQLQQQYGTDPLSIPDPEERQGYLNLLAQRDPQTFAEVVTRHDGAQRKALEAERLAALNRDYDAQRANLQARMAADKVTQAKADALVQRSIDLANDPAAGMSTGGKIAGILQSAIGGLIQGKTGSARNAGLDALTETINRNLANQREQLGFQRSMLAEETARHGDVYQAQETLRLGVCRA